MANEIYDSTWWGNTIDTASSIGTSTEMIQGQFNMLTSNQPNLVVNGDFATDSDWTKGTGVTINSGVANFVNVANNQALIQNGVFSASKLYSITFTISNYTQGGIRVGASTTTGQTISANGNYTEVLKSGTSFLNLYFYATSTTTLSIDNVSVKQVRATTVEASKCLADAIHRIGIQDIQN